MSSNNEKPLITPRTVPPELYAKYSRSGPRYTSYPTAPQFKAEFDRRDIERRWQASNATGSGLSLYLHVPFCNRRCLYCGCFTETGHGRDTTEAYVHALLAESGRMQMLIDPARPVRQLALGGGTPTSLSPELMATLINGLKQRFNFAPDIEFSIEIDPLSVDAQYLDVLSDLGFNRFSFGIQDLDPEVQRSIGRVRPAADIAQRIEHLHRLGHRAVNVDLIYGLPLQTPGSFSATISRIIELEPSRIAMFGYAHVPWVSPHQKALEKHHLPDPAERMELFGLGFELLLAAGFEHVGMDHFARSDDELIQALRTRSLTRNFMGYTTKRGLDLVGLGASSISSVGGTFTQNLKDIGAYIEQAGLYTWIKGLARTAEDELRNEVILELICNFHLDIAALERKYDIRFHEHFAPELAELTAMETDGLVTVNPTWITVEPSGRFFIRNICMPFDEYLKGERTTGRYSRTV